MVSSVFYGEIKDDRLISWNENHDPYDILKENHRVEKLSGWSFLDIAEKLFSDEVQVDWGSFAYQCTKEQLCELGRRTNCEIVRIDELQPGVVYGIVFVEES
jgi:hypothetical protein